MIGVGGALEWIDRKDSAGGVLTGLRDGRDLYPADLVILSKLFSAGHVLIVNRHD